MILMWLAIIMAIVFLSLKCINSTYELVDTTVPPLNLANVEDGIYYGEYRVGVFYCKVDLTISQHTIVSININKLEDYFYPKPKNIASQIMETQSFNVDINTQATLSVKILELAILDAIESHHN